MVSFRVLKIWNIKISYSNLFYAVLLIALANSCGKLLFPYFMTLFVLWKYQKRITLHTPFSSVSIVNFVSFATYITTPNYIWAAISQKRIIKLYLCQSFFKEYLISFLRILRLIDFAFVVLYLLMFKIWKKICSLKNKVFQIIGIIAMISNTIAVQIWKFKEKPIIWDALRDLVPFVQFKNVKNTHGGVLLLVQFLIENVNFNKKFLEF